MERRGQDFEEYDHLTRKQMKVGERNAEQLLDKDDLPTKFLIGNEKELLPQMSRVSLKKRSMQAYLIFVIFLHICNLWFNLSPHKSAKIASKQISRQTA